VCAVGRVGGAHGVGFKGGGGRDMKSRNGRSAPPGQSSLAVAAERGPAARRRAAIDDERHARWQRSGDQSAQPAAAATHGGVFVLPVSPGALRVLQHATKPGGWRGGGLEGLLFAGSGLVC